MIISGRPRLAFIYGSREVIWPGIAPFLFAERGVIRDVMLRCERLVRSRLNRSLEKIGGDEELRAVNAVEPLLTSVQIALTEAWRERGIEPDVIAARSGGEFAAEYARRTLTLENAVEVACRVSHLMNSGRGAGRVLSVRLAFGAGPHFCLGAHLSRIEASIALHSALQKLEEMARARPSEPIDFGESLSVRGPRRLDLTFRPTNA